MGFLSRLFGGKNKKASSDNNMPLSEEVTSNPSVSEGQKQYLEMYSEDDSPGWDAIDAELKRLYSGQKERHYGTIIKYVFGGKDPLDGFNIYDNNSGAFHRHVISYGMSELYYNPDAADRDFSKWGFEFTMRLTPFEDDSAAELEDGTRVDHEPYWVMNLMQNLARYVFQSGKWFEPYHFIPTNSPIREDTDTKIVGIAFVPDVQLNPIETPHGSVDFLQMVGLTQKELDWLWEDPKTTRVKELVDKMRHDNPFLITDLKRDKDYV